jgi:hypothetical protein
MTIHKFRLSLISDTIFPPVVALYPFPHLFPFHSLCCPPPSSFSSYSGSPTKTPSFYPIKTHPAFRPTPTSCDANPPRLHHKGHTCTFQQPISTQLSSPLFQHISPLFPEHPTYPEVSPLSSSVDRHPQVSPSSPSPVLRLPSSQRAPLPLTHAPVVQRNAMRLDPSRPCRAMLEDGLGWTCTYS